MNQYDYAFAKGYNRGLERMMKSAMKKKIVIDAVEYVLIADLADIEKQATKSLKS